jgi:hypothetical protein
MLKKHAIGIVSAGRVDLALKTLQSLYHTDQFKDSYDLYIIDNGSDPSESAELAEWVQASIVPVKNLIRTESLPIAPAWNLFLSLTQEYAYRTKLDNDLIFANTPVAAKPFEKTRGLPRPDSPDDLGPNPGAPRVAGFTVGAGHSIKQKVDTHHTRFLEHVEDSISQKNLGICAIPSVSVAHTLLQTMPILANKRWRGKAVLCGGCMTITKKTFDILGYFDETLLAHIDWEYSQRAMFGGSAINCGYTDNYCVIHLGESSPTLPPDVFYKNEMDATMLASKMDFKRGFIPSKWQNVVSKIIKVANKSIVVNLT